MESSNKTNFVPVGKFSQQDFQERTFWDTDKQKVVSSKDLKKELVYIAGHTSSSSAKTGMFLFEVEEGDGMTWTAEYFRQELHKKFDTFHCFCIKGTINSEELPTLSGTFPEEIVLKVAKRAKLVAGYRKNEWLKSILLSLGAALAAVLFTIALEIIKKNIPGEFGEVQNLFLEKNFYIAFAAALVLSLAGKFLADNKKLPGKEEAKARLVEKLQNRDVINSAAYGKFISSLASRLKSLGFPRFVIIDHFEGLLPVEQAIVVQYLNDKASFLTMDKEVWLVFLAREVNEEKTRLWQLKNRLLVRQFTLLPLTSKEKEVLVTKLGLPHEFMDFSTIKEICLGEQNLASKAKFKQALAAFKEKEPREKPKYGDLEFLYLLSQNAMPYSMKLSVGYLLDNFPTKNVRNEALKKILFNAALTRTEINYRLEGIEEHFPNLIEVDGGEKELLRKKIRLKSGVFEAFEESYGPLGLGEPALCHFFWSLFWGDKLLNHPVQYTWTRKLIFHLLRSKESFSFFEGNSEFKTLTNNYFNYFLLAITYSVKACYFREVISLLKNASFLVEDLFDFEPAKTVTLAKKSWQVYSIILDERVLEIVFDNFLRNTSWPQGHVENENILDALFFDTIPNSEIREHPGRSSLFYPDSEIEDTQAIRNYFRTLSAWLAISATPFTSRMSNLGLGEAASFSIRYLRNTGKAIDRLRTQQKDEYLEFDLRILSLSIWCQGLRFAAGYSSSVEADERSAEPPLDYPDFLDFIRQTLETLKEVKDREAKLEKHFYSANYFINGLLSEVVNISIAAMVIPAAEIRREALTLTRQAGEVPIPGFFEPFFQPLLGKINANLQLANEVFNTQMPLPGTFEELFQTRFFLAIDHLFELNSILWTQLGVSSLNDFLAIRRYQFKTIWSKDFRIPFEEERDAGNLPMNKPGYLGIMANVVVINGYENHRNKSYILARLVDNLLESGFGKSLVCELGMVELHHYYFSPHPLDLILAVLLDEETGFFRHFIARMPDEEFNTLFVALQNQETKILSDSLQNRLNEALLERIGQVADNRVRLELEDWERFRQMGNRIKEGNMLDWAAELENWKNRKESWLYPGMLSILISNGHRTAEVKKEALSQFDNLNGDTGNTRFNLALHLLYWLEPAELAIPLGYLHQNMWRFKNDQEIMAVISCYRELIDHRDLLGLGERDSVEFIREVEKLEKAKWLNNHLEWNRQQEADRNYFEMLLEYYLTLASYGFQCEISYNDFLSAINRSPAEKQAYIKLFLKDKQELPDLFLDQGVLNSKFLILGSMAFSPELREYPGCDVLRARVSQLARRQFPLILGMIRRMPLNPYFLQIMENFHQKSEHLDIPEN